VSAAGLRVEFEVGEVTLEVAVGEGVEAAVGLLELGLDANHAEVDEEVQRSLSKSHVMR